ARARQRIEEESEPRGFSSVTYGPYGCYGGIPLGYSYYVGPSNLSNRDVLIYAGYQSGRYRYGNGKLATPTRGRIVTVVGGTYYGGCNDAWGGGWNGRTYGGYGL